MRYFGVSLRRTLGSSAFRYCVLAAAALYFTAIIGYDFETGDDLMIAQLLFRSEDVRNNAAYSAFGVFVSGNNTSMGLFVPIIAAFPYVTLLCNERASQSARLTIIRAGKPQYTLGSVFGAVISGGLIMLFGYALFGIAVLLLFPHLSDYPPEQAAGFIGTLIWSQPHWFAEAAANGNLLLPALSRLAETFMWGALYSLPALTLSAFVRNTYVVICVPFFLTYAHNRLSESLTALVYSDFGHINEPLARALALTHPDAVERLFRYGKDAPLVLAVHLAFGCVLGAVFCIIMNGRTDCGE